MPKKGAKRIGRRNNHGKGGKNYTKKQKEQRASLITPLPKAPDAVNTVPPSPKRRKAAIAAEGKITSSAKPPQASLNKDVDDGVARHCALTGKLKDDDPKKFLRDTPERLTSAYLRVWTGWPPSERIVEDIL